MILRSPCDWNKKTTRERLSPSGTVYLAAIRNVRECINVA